jgi:PhnB protein
MMNVTPYLYFDGRTEEALNFYRETLGAEVQCVIKFSENPEPQYNPPGAENKVMHSQFRIGETELMASDGDCRGQANFAGISLTLSVADPAEADRLFGALQEQGHVQMSMAQTFFAKRFGMVADKFGVSWMVIAPAENQ